MRGPTAEFLFLGAILGLALLGLSGAGRPVDPQVLQVLWARAEREAPHDLTASIWLDVAKACSAVRPVGAAAAWRAPCQEALRAIDQARTADYMRRMSSVSSLGR